jgi:putative DNA primase/helicase
MRRLFGYAITGETKEQILPILWGEGANGKSTIMDTLSAVLGDSVCFNTQADSLMDVRQNDGDAARPFVVSLRNKRLIWASESKEGQRLNAGLVKQLTGDGYITARALFGNPVTFKQTHKIIMLTNHSPRIPDSDDYAMWRRVIRIPFAVRFMNNPKLPHERKQDKDLLQKLRAEYSGILAWLVRGCLEWQQAGLNPPTAVIESTEKYREDEDLTGQFCDERLTIGEGHEVPAGELYRAYSLWCDGYGYNAMSARAFGQRMTRRFGEVNLKWVNGKTQRMYEGVGLSP